jgi:uncharacterized repeat protein (TIGR01451 family)
MISSSKYLQLVVCKIKPDRLNQPWSKAMRTCHRSGLALLLGSSTALLTAIPVTAQLVIPFADPPLRPYRYQTNTRGEIKFVSNTVATCSPLRVTSSRIDSTGGSALINDLITYRFTVTNDASTTVNNLRLESLIPSGMTYVANSLKIGTATLTDAANDDGAEVSGNNINFRFGTGATSTSGGSFSAGETTIIEFQLKVNTTSGTIVTPATISHTEGSSIPPVNIRIPVSRTITVGGSSNSGINGGSTSATNASNCSLAKAGGTDINNNFNLVYTDVDDDSSTFNSSQSELILPSDAVVLFAGLYWGGSSTNSNRGDVKFAGPNGIYTPISASSSNLYSGAGTAYPSSYQGFVDVTNSVKNSGAGQYRVANIQSTAGDINFWGGWSLVVVYGSSTERPRNLTVYDGYASISNGSTTNTQSITISGFITPPFGTVNAKIGAIAYDGDSGSAGDSAKFQSSKVTPGMTTTFGTAKLLGDGVVNPTNDVFNSTISYLGTNIITKTPNYLNQLGYDADIYAANGIIRNNDNTATITLTTGGETYAPGVITSSIDLFIPVIDMGKSFVDLNGGNLEPGDILEYTIIVTNNKDANGNGDPANKNIVTDAIPANTTYVPGSLLINGVAKTDAGGDDTADFDGTSVPKKTTFRIGTNATATAGGRLEVNTGTPASPSATSTSTVKFKVSVNVNVPDNTDITNVANSSYEGATLGEGKSIAGASPGVTIKTDNSSISGNLYKDNNLNNTFNNGEPLLPTGIKVTLYKDVNGDGNIDLNDLIFSEVDTDANGKYVFLDIPNGNYIIRVDQTDPQIPTGKLLITPNNLTATVAGLPVLDRNFGFTPDPVAGNPNLLLVKRITAINGGTTTNGGDDLAIYKNTTSPYDDNVDDTPPFVGQPDPTREDTTYWPTINTFLLGGTDGGTIKPNDSIEYTIYFLSTGDSIAKNVLFCDRVPANVTFLPTAFNSIPAGGTGLAGADRGIAAKLGIDVLKSYTNTADSDFAQYFPPGVEPSTVHTNIKCGGTNDNGAVVVKLGDLNNATGAGTPTDSYGFVRFRGLVK